MFERFVGIASNLQFAISSAPKRDSQKNGVQFRNPETIRANHAIRANLGIDSLESGHLWPNAGGLGSLGGTRLMVFLRFSTPYRPKNTTSRDPYPASSRDPPCTSLGRGRGQGVPAREGVPTRGFLELRAVWAWEYHELSGSFRRNASLARFRARLLLWKANFDPRFAVFFSTYASQHENGCIQGSCHKSFATIFWTFASQLFASLALRIRFRLAVASREASH